MKTEKEEKNMIRSQKQTKAFILSLITGILIIGNTVLLGIATTWFPEMIPTLPGTTANDTTILYQLTVIGLMCGILVLIGAALLQIKPVHHKVWGIMIIVFSIPSVITGGGFIIGFVLGLIGGVSALSQRI